MAAAERDPRPDNVRDLRLDFFRGVALLSIFLDHIPGNVASYITLSNFAFCDAAEIFVFISGYTAALVFGGLLVRQGWVYAAVQVWKRCWTLYVAHIFLFVIFVAQVSYTATKFNNPMFVDEMKIADFLQEPHIAVLQALALRLQPNFMNILPLYIALLSGFALLLPVLRRWPLSTLAVSFVVYAAAGLFHLNLGTYPSGVWYFNPLTWQLIFVLGAAFALRPDRTLRVMAYRPLIWVSVAVVAVFAVIRGTLTFAYMFDVDMPPRVIEAAWMFANKTPLGPQRLVNFLALVHVVVSVLQRGHPLFNSIFARPIIRCGQESLQIFCLGVFLSVLGHTLVVEISSTVAAQFLVSAAGIAIMIITAYFLYWSKQRRREAAAPPQPPQAAVQGGE